MTSNANTGRWLVVAVIVSVLALSVLTPAAFKAGEGVEHQLQLLTRFLMTGVLCIFLYRRANWARWVAGIPFLLGGMGLLVAAFAYDRGDVLLGTMGVVYVAAALVLFFAPAVRTYFRIGSADVG